MKAVTCTAAALELTELPDPVPQRGQLLLQVKACGICGSDLHARHHSDDLADATSAVGYDHIFRQTDTVVLGHEYCGEVLDHGPRTRVNLRPGTRVVTLPLLRRGRDVHMTGLSPMAPGGYAELALAEASMSFAVPNGLSTELATLTEPMAVGLHAVNRGEVGKGQVAIVIGCGPVGLAVIGMLKAKGVRTVVASDFSPGRRALATAIGADIVVDPKTESPFDAADGHGHVTSAIDVFTLGVETMDKLRGIPLLPWERIWRAADKVGATTMKHPVIFECVGVPGVLDQLMGAAPLYSRIVVVGVCMQSDRIRPVMGINKEIDLRFVLGYTPLEFRDALHLLAEGQVNAAPVVTGIVGLAGVDAAFTALGDPEAQAKVLIDPSSTATTPQAPPPVG